MKIAGGLLHRSCALLVLLGFAGHGSTLVAQSTGTFAPTGAMSIARAFAGATLLANGQVLIVGGGSPELYEPDTGTFTAIGNMVTSRGGPTATLLGDGRVLIVGGDTTGGSPPPFVRTKNTAELYDPVSRTFTATGGTATGQMGGRATLLHDGKVLIAGGYTTIPDDGPATVANPELYDPSTGTFSPTGTFATTGSTFYVTGGPDVSSVTLLADGRVLFAGEPTSELYDPASGTFSLTGSMTTPCSFGGRPQYIGGRTATLLRDGKVLLTGGAHEDCGRFAVGELYDPTTGKFTITGSMTRPRDNHTATLLRDGKVLIAGGESQDCDRGFCGFSGTTASAETYDPSSGVFTAIGAMTARRAGQTGILLNNGVVLIAGGYGYAGIGAYLGNFASAELYVPPGTLYIPPIFDSATITPSRSMRDFNGDGLADVLWRDLAGNVSIWLTNGNTVPISTPIANVWTGWTIAGTGDFNGDGKADILWRDASGDVSIWLMDGNITTSFAALGNVWTGWTIAGVADFNGDRKADILWRDISGNVAMWLMNGSAIDTSSVIANVWTGWAIVGDGDFNGDGKADILWRDTAGRISVWLMEGYILTGYRDLGNVSASRTLAGVGDFDGDGRSDILWRDTAGNVSVWLTNGNGIANNSFIANVWGSWVIAGVGDLNGDGKADILWRDADGNASVWLMDGTHMTSFRAAGNVSDQRPQ